MSTGSYFYMLVQSLVDWGYKRDEDVRGAPYDWRKAPSKSHCYLNKILTLPDSKKMFCVSSPIPPVQLILKKLNFY